MKSFLSKKGIGSVVLLSLVAACTVDPEALTPEERDARIKSDLSLIREMNFAPTEPITLNVAIARAIAFNMEARVKEIEREIEQAELETRGIDMLPVLDLEAGHTRNSQKLSSSDDPITTTGGATITWNILDLGVSYSRAKQQANEVMIAREHQRKAFQDIVRQVRTAYWRAAGAERLMGKMQALAVNIRVAMRESRAMEKSGATDVAEAVNYRREIVESVRQAISLQSELREARAELAELLNIRPGVKFQLASASIAQVAPVLPMSLADMEKHALENRPELRIEDYNERMSVWQAREALFDMLPGAEFSAGRTYNTDAYNLFPNWTTVGFQLGMNLFDLFSGSSRINEAEKREELAKRQRLAATLAVMTQTHMAYIRFNSASQQMRLAREVARADRRLALLVAGDTGFETTDYFEAVRIATRQLQSEMDEHDAMVDLVAAHSEAMHSIGLDVAPENIRLDDLKALTEQVAAITANWEAKDADIVEPTETPLDQLVNAMLDGGETDLPPGHRKPEIREARFDDGETVPKEVVERLADIETAAGLADRRVTKPNTLPEQLDLTPADRALRPPDPESPAPPDPVEAAGYVDMLPPPEKEEVAQMPDEEKQPVQNATTATGHVVQLGVFKNSDKATRLRDRLTVPQDAALHGVDIQIVRRADNQGRQLHYVETATIADKNLAIEMCAMLRNFGQDCITATR